MRKIRQVGGGPSLFHPHLGPAGAAANLVGPAPSAAAEDDLQLVGVDEAKEVRQPRRRFMRPL